MSKCEPDWSQTAGRSLPHSEEAERCVLGCILIQPVCLDACAEKFAPLSSVGGKDVFYNENYGDIYETARQMRLAREVVDLPSLTIKLAGTGELERVGGPAAVADLYMAVPTAACIEQYLNVVCSRFQLRRLIEASTQAVQEAYECQDDGVESLLSGHYKVIRGISHSLDAGKTCRTLADILPEAERRIAKLMANHTGITGIPYTFRKFDDWTGGMMNKQMIILAARPRTGKSTLLFNMLVNVAKRGIKVGALSLESEATQTAIRIIAAESRQNMRRLHRLAALERVGVAKKVSDAIEGLPKENIYIDDAGEVTVDQMRSKIRRMVNIFGCKLVAVDYAQLVRAPGIKEKRDQVTAVSATLKQCAMDLNVPIIALSQLNRESEKVGGRPSISNLAESDALTRDADVVILLSSGVTNKSLPRCFQGVYRDDELENVVYADMDKNRDGASGVTFLNFIREWTRYEDMVWKGAIDSDDVPPVPDLDVPPDQQYGSNSGAE